MDPKSLLPLVVCVPALYLASFSISLRWHHVLLEFAGIASSVAMGFLNFASLAAVLCWLISWLLSLTDMPVERATIAWTFYVCSVLVAVFGLFNALTLRVTKYEIMLPNLPIAWIGRRVAVVSDIHLGNIFGARFVRKIVKQLNELEPTAVFISGDMFDGAVVDIPQAVEPWARFRAPGGTYFVTGNYEEIRDRAPYLAGLSNVGIIVLNNKKVIVDGLQIVGVHDAEAHRRNIFREILKQASTVVTLAFYWPIVPDPWTLLRKPAFHCKCQDTRTRANFCRSVF